MKNKEFQDLETEIVELIKRCETVVPSSTLYDLCTGGGRIFIGPYEDLHVYGIYYCYLEEQVWLPRMDPPDSDNSSD
jgi:hypothetical protein